MDPKILMLSLVAAGCTDGGLTQDGLDAIARSTELRVAVIENAPQGVRAKLGLENRGARWLAHGWAIYGSFIRRVLSSSSRELTITHLQGDLHEIAPTAAFSGFRAGEVKELPFEAEFWMVSESDLMPRFYDPTRGRVLVDGVDVRELELTELRRSVSVIFQETFLFSASAAENIAYGRPQATRTEIEACARAAQAHEFIMDLEDGYDTIIGERGVSLSGGQRQRIAIARAFLMDPRILILDDATASVDSQTERLIQEAMRKLCEGRTTFVIAQRFSTVQHADLILVLREGRIVERGKHDELIQRSGFYREVFEQQIRR